MLLQSPWRGAAPGSPSKLTGASTLSRGLLFAFSGHQGFDLVKGIKPTPILSTQGTSFNLRKWGFAGGGGGTLSALDFGTGGALADLHEQPATWAFMARATSSGAVGLMCQTDLGNFGWQIGSFSSPAIGLGLICTRLLNNVYKGITETVTANVPFTLVVTYNGGQPASGINIYLNGVLGTTSSSQDGTGSTSSAASEPMYLGAKTPSNGGFPRSHDGDIYVALVANRIWSPAEVREFHKNPYQAFQGPQGVGWFAKPAVIAPMSGVIAATAALSGSLARVIGISGTITATSTFTGVMGSKAVLSGTIAASAALSGVMSKKVNISGVIAAVSTLTGSLINTAVANIVALSARDNRTVDVVFNRPVIESDAINPTKYTVDNGLTVVKAQKITSTHYLLTTTRQTNGTNYTVTISGIGGA